MLLSMCTVWSSHSKWLSEYSTKSAPNFALSLNIPPQNLLRWFRSLQLWGWLAASSQQCVHSCIMSHAKIFGKTLSYPGDSAPLQPRFGAPWLLAFPKTKITFEREEISDHQWDSEKYNRVADGDWENCVRPKVPTLNGTVASLSYIQCFLYLLQ